MTEQAIRTLADQDISRVIVWAEDELRVRAEKRKHDTLAKIRELAESVGLSITISSKQRKLSKRDANVLSRKDQEKHITRLSNSIKVKRSRMEVENQNRVSADDTFCG